MVALGVRVRLDWPVLDTNNITREIVRIAFDIQYITFDIIISFISFIHVYLRGGRRRIKSSPSMDGTMSASSLRAEGENIYSTRV